MSRSSPRLLAALMVLAFVATPVTATAGGATGEDTYEIRGLDGPRSVALPTEHGQTATSELGELVLPSGVRQGDPDWYVLDFYFDVAFVDESPGTVYVTVLTNGFAAAKVRFRPSVDTDGTPVVLWDTVGVPEGYREFSEPGLAVSSHFVNFPQLSGLTGGTNELTVEVDLYDGANLEHVRVLPATQIRSSATSPEPVVLSVELNPTAFYPGATVSVPFRLTNVGPSAATEVVVSLRTTGELETVGATKHSLPDLTGDSPQSGTFEIRVGQEGEGQLFIQVESSLNDPSRAFEAVIGQPTETSGGPTSRQVAVGVVGVGLVVGLGRLIRRRRSTADVPSETGGA